MAGGLCTPCSGIVSGCYRFVSRFHRPDSLVAKRRRDRDERPGEERTVLGAQQPDAESLLGPWSIVRPCPGAISESAPSVRRSARSSDEVAWFCLTTRIS